MSAPGFTLPLAEVQSNYRQYTALVSERVRSLALGGIAAAWLLKGAAPKMHGGLALAIILLVMALGLDLGQYLVQAIAWQRADHKIKEPLAGDTLVPIDGDINAWGNGLLWAKTLVALAGSVVLTATAIGMLT